MYTILKPGMGPGSGNVGDKLVLENTKRLLAEETGIDEFRIYHRESDLTSVVDKINDTCAVIMPVFDISNQLNSLYRLTDDITDIKVPLVPLGASWGAFPGDILSINQFQFTDAVREKLTYIAKQVETFATRDDSTTQVLHQHGIDSANLVGDCAWYNLDVLGTKMAQPTSLKRVVVTTPHRRMYMQQAKKIIRGLAEAFPSAELICSLHNEPYPHDRQLADHARSLDYTVVRASLDTDNIEFYADCDLHIGYRLHGHIGFLRHRLPSVLLHEDGRGVGLTRTLGVGGFDAFDRRLSPPLADYAWKVGEVTGKKWMSERLIAPPDGDISEEVIGFTEAQLDSGFESYAGLGEFIDSVYDSNMKPFLSSLPQ